MVTESQIWDGVPPAVNPHTALLKHAFSQISSSNYALSLKPAEAAHGEGYVFNVSQTSPLPAKSFVEKLGFKKQTLGPRNPEQITAALTQFLQVMKVEVPDGALKPVEGGVFIPKTLVDALNEQQDAYEKERAFHCDRYQNGTYGMRARWAQSEDFFAHFEGTQDAVRLAQSRREAARVQRMTDFYGPGTRSVWDRE